MNLYWVCNMHSKEIKWKGVGDIRPSKNLQINRGASHLKKTAVSSTVNNDAILWTTKSLSIALSVFVGMNLGGFREEETLKSPQLHCL